MDGKRTAQNRTGTIWCITLTIFLVTTGAMLYFFDGCVFCTAFGELDTIRMFHFEKIVVGSFVSFVCFTGMQYMRLKMVAMHKGKECFIAEQKYRVFLTEANDAIIVVNVRTGRITEANRAAEQLFGRPMKSIIGMHRADIHPKDTGIDYDLLFANIIREGNMHAEEIEVLHATKGKTPIDMSASLVRMNGDTVIIGILHDISTRLCATREAERYITELRTMNARLEEQKRLLDTQAIELAQQVRTDALTGLPNRNAFLERWDLAMAASKRHGHTVALMFIDLDKFKAVNDMFGHDAGDVFLKVVAKRGTIVCKRSTELFARLGGDEFVVLLPEVKDVYEVIAFTETLLRMFNETFDCGAGHVTRIEASIGIAVGTGDEDLLKRADEAMYKAKKTGNTYFLA